MSFYTEQFFLYAGLEIIHVGQRMGICSVERHFKAVFGVSTYVCHALWKRMSDKDVLPEKALGKHLLWTLKWLKLYLSNEAMCAVCNCSENTFRKWRDIMVEGITRINVVSEKQMSANTKSISP